ncbi:MAG: hypothetical protein ABFD82_16495 [Syntrophaceae bacterium]
MSRDTGWNLLGIFRAGSMTVFSILLIALMGGVFLPVVGDFLTDILLWFVMSLALVTTYVRAAYTYRRRLAEHTGMTVDALATLSEVTYEIFSLLGGGFFGILFSSLAWKEYRNSGSLSGDTLLMAGMAAIFLGACAVSFVKFLRYLRTDTKIDHSGRH